MWTPCSMPVQSGTPSFRTGYLLAFIFSVRSTLRGMNIRVPLWKLQKRLAQKFLLEKNGVSR